MKKSLAKDLENHSPAKPAKSSSRGKISHLPRISAEDYSSLFLSLPIPVAILTLKEGIFLEINNAFCRQTGYSREEVIGKSIMDLGIYIQVDQRKEFINALQVEGEISNVETTYRLKTGQVVPCLRSSTVLHLNGKACILSVLQNISVQKQAEKTLEETAIKFQTLFENSRDAIGVSKAGIHEYVNPAYLELFGYTSFDELQGRPLFDLIAPDSRPLLMEIVSLRSQGKKAPSLYETRGLRRDGSEYDMEVRSSSYELNGELYTLGLIRDITDRKQAVSALNERMKEATCLSEIRHALSLQLSQEELCKQIVKKLVPAMQFPDITVPVIDLDGERYTTKRFGNTLSTGIHADIVVKGNVRGHLRVYYLEDRPFLIPYEQNLIEGIAKDLSLWLERNMAESAMRASDENYSRIVETAAEGIIAFDADWRITFANARSAEILGYGRDELPGKPLESLILDEDRSSQARRKAIREAETGSMYEGKYRTKSGAPVWLHVTASAAKVNGKFTGAFILITDISARKHDEEQLMLLKYSIDTSKDCAYRMDMQGNILYTNKSACEVLGYSAEEMMKLNVEDIAPRFTKERWAEISAFIKENVQYENESIHRRKDGSEFPVEISSTYIVFEGKEYINGFAKDITERKKAEEAVRESQERFLKVFQNSSSGINIFRLSDNCSIDCNDSFLEMIGYAREEVVARPSAELNLFVDLSVRDTWMKQLRQGQPVRNQDIKIRRKSGEVVDVLASFDIIEVNNEPAGLVMATDITERKHAEETLRMSEAQLKDAQRMAHIGSSQWDARRDTTIWSEEMFRITGWDPALPGPTRAERARLYTPDSFTRINDAMTRAIAEAEPYDLEVEIVRPDGVRRHAQARGGAILDDGGAIIGLQGTLQDITDRKEAEEALKAGEIAYRNLFDNTANGILVVEVLFDENGKPCGHQFVRGNAAFEKLTGIARNDVIGKTDKEVSLGWAPDYIQRFYQVAITGEPFEYERFNEHFQKHYETRIFSPQQGQFAVVFTDITERKQAEFEQARQSEELARLYRASGSLLTGSTLDLHTTAQSILKIVQEDFDQTNCSLFLVQEDSNKLYRISTVGPFTDQVKENELSIEGPGLVPLAIRTGQSNTVGDVTSNSAYLSGWKAAKSELTIPLKIVDRVIGCIDIQSAKPGAFSADDERLMTIFSERAALTLEHARLYTQMERWLENLTALRSIDVSIAGSFDIDITMGILIDQAKKRLGIEAADVLIFNPASQTFRATRHRASGDGFLASTQRLGNSLAGQVFRERSTITVDKLAENSSATQGSAELIREGLNSYMGVPLVAKGLVKGVLEIYHREPIILDKEQHSFLDLLAGQAAIAIDNALLFDNLQTSNFELRMAYDETIEGWSQAMDLRDRETEGHTQRVTEMTVKLAERLGMSLEELIHIRRGALLHDMGKLGVPDEVLRKPGKLTDDEWVIMRKHPQFAYDMLAQIAYLKPALDIPYCHHEKWDGSGYPRGLKENQIPLAARIFAVVDVWDALTSDRPYREAWSKEKTRAYIIEQSGKHFDPKIVEIFLKEVSQAG